MSKETELSFCFHSGALFSLNGPAALVRQKDSARPSLVAASCLSGLSRAVRSCSSGQQKASGAKREGEEWKSRESAKKNQGRTVRKAFRAQILQIKALMF